MNPLANPFLEFRIAPCFGRNEVAITWQVAPGLTGTVLLYRSPDGVKGSWKLINEGMAGGLSGQFVDFGQPNDDMFVIWRYRGVLDTGGPPEEWIPGPIVSPQESLSRSEYFITREIIRREYLSMSAERGNGVPAFHLIPKTGGVAVDHYDEETGQTTGVDCPDDPDSGFGTPWQGGFHPPLQTWVRIDAMEPWVLESRLDLTGDNRKANVNFRLLAFPRPDVGHLIVLPGSDRRYVISDPINSFYLRGAVPLFWEAKGLLLERTDPRCRIRMPELRDDPVWRMAYRND